MVHTVAGQKEDFENIASRLEALSKDSAKSAETFVGLSTALWSSNKVMKATDGQPNQERSALPVPPVLLLLTVEHQEEGERASEGEDRTSGCGHLRGLFLSSNVPPVLAALYEGDDLSLDQISGTTSRQLEGAELRTATWLWLTEGNSSVIRALFSSLSCHQAIELNPVSCALQGCLR